MYRVTAAVKVSSNRLAAVAVGIFWAARSPANHSRRSIAVCDQSSVKLTGDEGTESGDPADEPLDINLSLLGLPIQGALISGPLPPVANPVGANPGLLGAECPGEDIRSGSDSQLLMPLISGLTFCGVKVGCADCRGVLLRLLTALLAPGSN